MSDRDKDAARVDDWQAKVWQRVDGITADNLTTAQIGYLRRLLLDETSPEVDHHELLEACHEALAPTPSPTEDAARAKARDVRVMCAEELRRRGEPQPPVVIAHVRPGSLQLSLAQVDDRQLPWLAQTLKECLGGFSPDIDLAEVDEAVLITGTASAVLEQLTRRCADQGIEVREATSEDAQP